MIVERVRRLALPFHQTEYMVYEAARKRNSIGLLRWLSGRRTTDYGKADHRMGLVHFRCERIAAFDT